MSHPKPAKREKTGETTHSTEQPSRTCVTCHRDVTSDVYIRCAKCIGFTQCLECFSVGMETGSHIHTHPYMIMESMSQSVYRENWTAEEEVLLLHGIQVCGLGNWHEIENIIKTKSHRECEVHYYNTYLQSPIAPLPIEEIMPPIELPPPPEYDTSPRDSRPSISHEKNLQDRGKKEKTTPAEFAGWMPRRNEFEVEYQNEAEQLIAGINFSDDEPQAKLDQDLQFLRVYNEILEDRHRHTEFALKWDLLDEDFKSFGGRTKVEREMEEALMPLAQAVPREPLTEFIHSLEREMQLKENIQMLINWRKNGIATRDEGLMFNELQRLMNEDKLTPAQVEKWNKESMMRAESPEFRSSLDRQLLTSSENRLCHQLLISPSMYLYIKDLLIREFDVLGEMTPEIAASYIPEHAELLAKVYQYLQSCNLFSSTPHTRLSTAQPKILP